MVLYLLYLLKYVTISLLMLSWQEVHKDFQIQFSRERKLARYLSNFSAFSYS
jgi:hypothetical protein